MPNQKCALCHSIGDKGNKKGPLDGVGDQAEGRRDPRVDRRREGDDREDQGDAKARDEGLRAAEGGRGRARRVHGVAEEVALERCAVRS